MVESRDAVQCRKKWYQKLGPKLERLDRRVLRALWKGEWEEEWEVPWGSLIEGSSDTEAS